MKKLLLTLVILFSIALPAKATIFGFMDNKFYDENQSLKYFGFMDGSFFDLSGKQVWKVNGEFTYTEPLIVPVIIPENSTVIKSYCIDPVNQWKSERAKAEEKYLSNLSKLNPVIFGYIGMSNQLRESWQPINDELTSQINQRTLECNQKYNYFW